MPTTSTTTTTATTTTAMTMTDIAQEEERCVSQIAKVVQSGTALQTYIHRDLKQCTITSSIVTVAVNIGKDVVRYL